MTPTNSYYFGLYLLVFIIRFFKVWKEHVNNKKETKKFNWKPVFFVSLEIVYTSAGFVIVLLEYSKEWVPAIVIFYIILVIVSSFIDSLDDKFSDGTKFITHFILVVLIVAATLISFGTFLKPKTETKSTMVAKHDSLASLKKDSLFGYKVALPYVDNTLIEYLGHVKMNMRKLVATFWVVAKNNDDAIDSAKAKFWTDKKLLPLFPNKKSRKEELLFIDESNMVVQKMKAL